MKRTHRDLTNVPHYVYRYYDARNRPLYFGCTINPEAREKQHRTKSWFAQATRREIDRYPNMAEGRAAEKAAITAESPIHNVQLVIVNVRGHEMPKTTLRNLQAARQRYFARKAAAS